MNYELSAGGTTFTGSHRSALTSLRLSLRSGFSRLGQWLQRVTRLKVDEKEPLRPEGKTPEEAGCIFCQLHRPDVNRIMHENKTFYVRYDNFPAAAGHVEVVPKRHVESFFELTARELKDAYALIQAAQKQISKEHHPDGYTIGINEGRAAGRTVDHLHIHLIPRHFGDVEDPRGGIRRAAPNCEPDAWAQKSGRAEAALKALTEAQPSRR
ncbi:HIT family protein [Streptomyces sp. NPDC052236]|uniref:HIT family protein n=1 Tax=Streptomyces sp. NPDC052236 TaxID=3365686 RepID=UPI0037D51027